MRRIGAALVLAWAVAPAVAAPAAEPTEPPSPDLLFFAKHLAADLHARCASCHSDPESAGGGYLLRPLEDARDPESARVLENFRATIRHLDAERPAQSALLRKALGEGHPGGAIYARDTKDFDTLLHFAMGATLYNRPPEAILPKRAEADTGAEVALDGTLSGDPDRGELGFAWRLVDRPAGSRAELRADGGRARLAADRPGPYLVELRVHDGKLWSLPASVLVVAREPGRAAPAEAAPAEKPLLERRLDPQRIRLIRRLTYDLKGRGPDLPELLDWYPRSHAEMVRAYLGEEETWEAWYEQQLYYFLLLDQFRPKEGRITTIPRRLARGELSLERALEEIVRSQYFNARNPGNDTFVTVVLEQCLGLVVQERKNKSVLDAGKKMYDGYRTKLFREQGDSQADFVRIVFAQPEFYEHLLRRTWKDLHGRDLEPKALAALVRRCVAERDALRAIFGEWLAGPAYVEGAAEARLKAEIPYVRALFLDTLGRLPSYDELRNVRNAFLSLADPTPIRLVMGRVLLESGEARVPASAVDAEVFVKEQFLRLLARQPTEAELTAFAESLRSDPAVTPRVVLWTLISSSEYQTY